MLVDYIKKSVSPFHTVAESKNILIEAGFAELDMTTEWELDEGGKYFVVPYKSSIFAFVAGEKGLRIAAAHTDSPCPHVKPKAEQETKGYIRLNCETYGGPILNTWMDRPLSMAGRVLLKSDKVFAPREVMIDFARPILTIPNLAIHYNREVNKGVELKKQNDMLPIIGMVADSNYTKDNYFTEFLAEELGEKVEDILDFDLYVYNWDSPEYIGYGESMLSSPRLDNLTSCYACLKGIKEANPKHTSVIALFDNEEIGSGTKQGADSALLRTILTKIYRGLGREDGDLESDIAEGFLLSADVAHALHPAKLDKYDSQNSMCMNEGVTFKLSINQKYSYDAVAVAALQQLCEKYDIKYKKFVNNADMPGGSTLGPIISSWLPMKTIDVGVPILAMHSARELMGADDQAELNKLMKAFFEEG